MSRMTAFVLLLGSTLFLSAQAPVPVPVPAPVVKPKVEVPVWHGHKLSRVRDKRVGTQKYFHPAKFRMAAPPNHFDLRPSQPPIYDQGQLGSCVDNGVGGVLEYCQMRQGWTTTWTPSRLYAYYWARSIEGTIGEDSGSSIQDGVLAIAQKGTVPETEWPYVISQFTNQPTANVIKDAAPNIISDYARCPDNSRPNIMAAVSSGHPVIIGFDVYANFPMDTSTGGVIPMPAGQVEGGHCVVIVGYDFDGSLGHNGYYVIRNSWNVTWGDKGYGYMPAAMVESSQYSSDFWIIASIPGGGVNPPPPPPPSPTQPFDIGITLASKTVTVASGNWRVYQGGNRQTAIMADPTYSALLIPHGWKAVHSSSKGVKAIPWLTIITVVEELIQKYGPAYVPAIKNMVDGMDLPPFVKAIIDQILDMAVGQPKKKAG